MTSMQETTVAIAPFDLSCGKQLEAVEQRITWYGDLASPAVLVPHALTGSSRVLDWWGGLAGDGRPFDPQRCCIIGINALGGCYGSSGPSTVADFPRVSVRDLVAAQACALTRLGVLRLECVIGASLGGMQALQWAVDHPHRVVRAVMVGAHDHHSAMGIALNAIQREAISIDARRGLRLARKIAMLSYKSEQLFAARHDRRSDRNGRFQFDIEGYLDHQADIFERRMDYRSYAALTEAMDSFDLRGAEPAETSPALLFVGISSDRLFLAQDVRAAAARFAAFGYRATYREIESDHGHDAFLAEPGRLAALLSSALVNPAHDAPC